jgi:hypothetical protein
MREAIRAGCRITSGFSHFGHYAASIGKMGNMGRFLGRRLCSLYSSLYLYSYYLLLLFYFLSIYLTQTAEGTAH